MHRPMRLAIPSLSFFNDTEQTLYILETYGTFQAYTKVERLVKMNHYVPMTWLQQ